MSESENGSKLSFVGVVLILSLCGLLYGAFVRIADFRYDRFIQTELQKIPKIESALNQFYDTYKVLPGDSNFNGIIEEAESPFAVASLIDEGLLYYDDFRTKLAGGFYTFHGCGKDMQNKARMIKGPNTCIRPVLNPGMDENFEFSWQDTGNPKFWCIMEVVLDNRRENSGKIRQWGAEPVVFSDLLGKFKNLEDCMTEKTKKSGMMAVVVW